MDITDYISSRRNEALLVGDYGLYRKQLSRRLLTVRRKLGRTTPKGRKYTSKAPITEEDISSNHEFIHLLLLTSERAWAHAMYMKSMRSADSAEKAISGSTRKHIISRLHKSVTVSAQLVDLLKADKKSTAGKRNFLEARAYHSLLKGTLEFESQKWDRCLAAYSEAHILYTSLAKTSDASQDDSYRGLLSSIVEPSLRYAAYQVKLPRTLPIDSIVLRFLQDSTEIHALLKDGASPAEEDALGPTIKVEKEIRDLPKTITWRSRTVKIEDANIAQALASVSAAEQKLTLHLSASNDIDFKGKAAAFDEVLIPSQDAVDATKSAIDELTADGVAQSDQRMQALQITRTAVNYALVGWRIGRNRVLCGRADGVYMDSEPSKKTKRGKEAGVKVGEKEESNSRKLARLRERVVLYDTTLQSLESIKELPGVAADQTLLNELEMKRSYFAALRCLSIARSHAILGHLKNSLALFARALEHSSRSLSNEVSTKATADKPPNLEVTPGQSMFLQQLLQGLVSQHRALVELHNLSSDAAKAASLKESNNVPLIERLYEYPANGADLTNLVVYPPQLRPIPVKPIFLDVAFNYIEYPWRTKRARDGGSHTSDAEGQSKVEEKSQTRKGWFGFGR